MGLIINEAGSPLGTGLTVFGGLGDIPHRIGESAPAPWLSDHLPSGITVCPDDERLRDLRHRWRATVQTAYGERPALSGSREPFLFVPAGYWKWYLVLIYISLTIGEAEHLFFFL